MELNLKLTVCVLTCWGKRVILSLWEAGAVLEPATASGKVRVYLDRAEDGCAFSDLHQDSQDGYLNRNDIHT